MLAVYCDPAAGGVDPRSEFRIGLRRRRCDCDQRVGDGITLFGRYGNLVKGELPFNQAVAVGAQFSGSYWDRGADASYTRH